MADIESKNSSEKGKRSHRISTKIDMTPMVDLAFLLITFFMLTTTFHKPKALELLMPEDAPPGEFPASKAITILLGEQDKVYWFSGSEDAAVKPDVHESNYGAEGIRQVLLEKNKIIGNQFTVVIKALDKSKYKNMVDILDEMSITNTKRFAIVATSDADLELIQKLKLILK